MNAGPRRCFTVSDVLVHNCVFGWEFGQGPRSLYMLWQEIFANESEAAKCQSALKRLFPKVDQWQSDVRLEADRLTQLMTRFGFVRRFYDVYQRKPVADNYQARGNERIYQNGKTGQKWLLKPGDDHEACIALRPANDAFGIKRMVMVQLMEEGLDERFGLINEIHDALVFDCDAAREAECVERVTKIMTAPCPYLKDPVVAPEGLWCGVSLAIGTNWDNFEEL